MISPLALNYPILKENTVQFYITISQSTNTSKTSKLRQTQQKKNKKQNKTPHNSLFVGGLVLLRCCGCCMTGRSWSGSPPVCACREEIPECAGRFD